MLTNIRIVLIETSHPGNIGAVARAMKNMGLEGLYLVKPRQFPSAEASARASGADDLLAGAVACQTLDQALTGCTLVIAASARSRRLQWPLLDPRACAGKVVSECQHSKVAIVFGREQSGLTNEELSHCHYLVHIPCNAGFSSLNLSAAVQIIAYEILLAYQDSAERQENIDRQNIAPRLKKGQSQNNSSRNDRNQLDSDQEGWDLARAEDMENFYRHLEQVMIETGFLDPERPKHLMKRLRRLFSRARPDDNEINILRGILTSVQRHRKH